MIRHKTAEKKAQATLVAFNAQYVHTAAGIYSLAAYAGKELDLSCLSFNINEAFDQILQSIYEKRSPIICFSCYIWNIELIYKVAQALYAMDESLCILLGGPEVSYDPLAQLEEHAFLKGILCGEGEKSFLAFVKAFYDQQDFSGIAGLCYRESDKLFDNGPAELLNGEEIPIAYNFEELPKPPQIIYYESSRGCPYRCAFCLSRGEKLRLRPLEDTLAHLKAFVDHGAKQVKLIDRSFNADLPRAKKIWQEINQWNTDCNFHFEIAATALDDEAIEILNASPKGRYQFEIGVQSTNPDTKRVIDRPESFEKLKKVVWALQKGKNIHMHLDLIAGLPKENIESFGQSFRDVFALKPDMLQLGFLKLLKGSHLRAIAEDFGCRYSAAPPYEVRRTSSMQPEDFFLLKRCERALDLFYHAPFMQAATLYLLEDQDSFAFFCELGDWIAGRNLHKPLSRIQALWDFAQHQKRESEPLREMLLYHFLKLERSPSLPLGFEGPNQREKEKLRLFYQKEGAKLFPNAKGNPWRFCQVQAFEYDIMNFSGEGKPSARKNCVLFDYQNGRQIDITDLLGR